MNAGRRRALVGLGIGLALADSSVVTLALPDILRRFDVEIPQVAWVLTSYNLGLAHMRARTIVRRARRRALHPGSRRRAARLCCARPAHRDRRLRCALRPHL